MVSVDPLTMDDRLITAVVERMADPDGYAAFRSEGEHCGWCRQPVRLRGRVSATDIVTGEHEVLFSSSSTPSGVLLKACGTRRETRCPSCARIYRGDARQIISAGLCGGKGVPDTVGVHPAVFATFTAPGFGAVHGVRNKGGRRHPCRPGTTKARCVHGRPLSCWRRHDDDDSELGEPLCEECFDYEAAVLFNALASELWRRTTIYLRRMVARLAGMTEKELHQAVRISFAKVVEYQRRGVVHVHAVIRMDGTGDEPTPPPPGLDAGVLSVAVQMAAKTVRVPVPGSDGEVMGWGAQLDVRRIAAADEGPGAQAVANYIAKYATKSTDPTGVLDHRFTSADDLATRPIPPHLRRLVVTAWTLGGRADLAELRLRYWTHDLGYRGHWLTKSRNWSTTFKALREESRAWRLERVRAADPDSLRWSQNAELRGEWEYAGWGWGSRADAYLAESERRAADVARRAASEDRCVDRAER